MIYTKLGDDGTDISKLGFGCSRFSSYDLDDIEGLERCAQLVVSAIESGINFFDVAPAYAHGKAEKIMGMALQQCRETVHVNTKSISYDDPSADDVRRRLERSLKTMRS